MSERAHQLRQALVARLLAGPGTATADARRASFDPHPHDQSTEALLARVARAAWTVAAAGVAVPSELPGSAARPVRLVGRRPRADGRLRPAHAALA